MYLWLEQFTKDFYTLHHKESGVIQSILSHTAYLITMQISIWSGTCLAVHLNLQQLKKKMHNNAMPSRRVHNFFSVNNNCRSTFLQIKYFTSFNKQLIYQHHVPNNQLHFVLQIPNHPIIQIQNPLVKTKALVNYTQCGT